MSKVFTALAVSVDGYITGRHPGPGHGRIGATVAGRNTYDDSDGFGGTGGPHPTAPLFVVSHRHRVSK